MKNRWRILGLLLLALVAALAVNASTAHAKWLLLQDGQSVLSLNLEYEAKLSELLVPDLGLIIHCTHSVGTIDLSLSGDHKTLTDSMEVTYHGCDDLIFGGVCSVHSLGEPDGLIGTSGSGIATMSGEKVLLNVASTDFGHIQYLGPECPLTEIDGRLSGSMQFELAGPLSESILHPTSLVGQGLFFGQSEAELHNAFGGAVSGSARTLGNDTFAVHLVGL